MSTIPPGRGCKLTPDQRAILARLVADRPGDSAAMVALAFEDRTGRPVHRQTVFDLRKKGGYAASPGNGHLSSAEREMLAMLVLEDDREHQTSAEVAARFEALTGRKIAGNTVREFRARLGLSRSSRGPGSRLPRKEVS